MKFTFVLVCIIFIFGCATQNEHRAPDNSVSQIVAGVNYVTVAVLEERLSPSPKGTITNRIYRGQKLDVYEVKNGWARVSKYYDGAIEGKSGKVARWVDVKGLSAHPQQKKMKKLGTSHQRTVNRMAR